MDLELFVVASMVVGLAGAASSFFRGLMAVRAKERLKAVVAASSTSDIRRILAKKNLDRAELESVLQQLEAELAHLSSTDRALLEPGLTKNTRRGTERFIKEMVGA